MLKNCWLRFQTFFCRSYSCVACIVKLTCKDHYHCFIHIFIKLNSIGGVMVGMLAVSVVDRGWLESDRDKPFRLNIWYYIYAAKQTPLRSQTH